MKVHDRVRNMYADLAKVADQFDLILGIRKRKRSKKGRKGKKVRPEDLREILLESLGRSPASETTIAHAMEVHRYCMKNKKEVKKLYKKKKDHIDEVFFEISSKVFEREESSDELSTVLAILSELRKTIEEQKAIVKDLTHVEREEFSHLEEWGLKHRIGSKKRIHITDFAHKLEKKIKWKHGNEENNSEVVERLVRRELDPLQRQLHLYIISLVKLKHLYESVDSSFDSELKAIKDEEKYVKGLLKKKFGTSSFESQRKSAQDKAEQLKDEILTEGEDLELLAKELKEVEARLPEIEFHKRRRKGPSLLVEGHPVQINNYEEKHPENINLDHLFMTKETDTLLLGSEHEFCHIHLNHAAPVHARLVKKDNKVYLFNEKGSPGTFVIRKKIPVCIVQDSEDQKLLLNRMAMPETFDYKSVIKRKTLSFKTLPPEKFSFPLQDKDLIVLPPGYKFRFRQ